MSRSSNNIPLSSSILIILTGSLGDIIRALCLVCHLKSHWPQSRISWLVEARWAELIRLHRQIDKVIIFRRKWRVSTLWQIYKELSQQDFDITLDLQRIFKSGLFSLLSGAKRRIGVHRNNAKELNWLFNNEQIPYFDENLSKLRHYLKFTEQLGLPRPTALDFGFDDSDLDKMLPPALVEIQKSFVALVMGSSWETKDWHFEGYCRLVQQILTFLRLNVVLLGDSSQSSTARRLLKNIDSHKVIDLTGNSLVEMTAVLKAALAGVGPDSGPGHLAAAVGTPYVTLFGPTPPDRHAPYGCDHLVVRAESDCVPCYKKRCPDRNRECMYDLTPQMVMEKLSTALNGTESNNPEKALKLV